MQNVAFGAAKRYRDVLRSGVKIRGPLCTIIVVDKADNTKRQAHVFTIE